MQQLSVFCNSLYIPREKDRMTNQVHIDEDNRYEIEDEICILHVKPTGIYATLFGLFDSRLILLQLE